MLRRSRQHHHFGRQTVGTFPLVHTSATMRWHAVLTCMLTAASQQGITAFDRIFLKTSCVISLTAISVIVQATAEEALFSY